MIRNILDGNGDVIGQIELPDDTPEAVWEAKLTPYAGAPTMSDHDRVKAAVLKAQAFGHDLIVEFAVQNILNGLTASQIAALATKLAGVQALLSSGSLHTALLAIQSLTPDANLTQDTINDFAGRIQDYLGS